MLGRVALRRVDVDWDDREKDVDDERAWKSRGRGRFTGRSTNETKGDLLTGVTPAPNDMAIEEAEIEGGADRLSAVRSWPSRTWVRTGPQREVRVSGPEIVGPDLCRGGQGQLLFGPDLGVGPGPDLDRTYFLCESNVFFLMP